MNTSRITHAAKEIERLQMAVKWLEEFGPKVNNHEASEHANVSIRMNFAGSCNGAKEVGEIISTMVGNRMRDLIDDALKNCENTIEIYRNVIRDEASS
ncbi:MAG: hypothetical protein ACPG6L_11520 [Nereida ignava]